MIPPATLRALRATLASFAAMGVLWGAFAGMAPATKAMLGAADATWGLMFLCATSGAILAMQAAPWLGARLGNTALPLGTLAIGLAFMLPGHLAAIPMFAGAMALVGMTSGSLDVVMNARVSAIEAEENRHLMGLHHGVFSLAYALSAALTGPARAAGAGSGAVLTVAGLAAACLALLAIDRRPHADPPGPQGPGRAPLGLVPVLGGIVILVGFLAENSAEAWSALHIERTLGGAPGLGSYGPALLGLTMGIGRLSGQAVAAHLPEALILRGAALTAAAGALTAALAPGPAVGYAGFVILGLGISVIAPVALALIGRRAARPARARAIARASVIGYFGFFIGPTVLGTISEFAGLRASFATVALILAAVVPLVGPLARRPD